MKWAMLEAVRLVGGLLRAPQREEVRARNVAGDVFEKH